VEDGVLTVEVEGDKVLDKLLAYPITVPEDTQLDWQVADQSQDQSGSLPPSRPSLPSVCTCVWCDVSCIYRGTRNQVLSRQVLRYSVKHCRHQSHLSINGVACIVRLEMDGDGWR